MPVLTRPSFGRFVLMWANDPAYSKTDMVKHTSVIRELGAQGLHGLTCRQLYVDQVTIVFRNANKIPSVQFWPGDSAAYALDVETQNLQLVLRPGLIHPVYVDQKSVRLDQQHYVYSSSLALHNNATVVDGYTMKVYRPIRDVPVATQYHNVGQLELELVFPILRMGGIFAQIPDNRVAYVIVEFAYEE